MSEGVPESEPETASEEETPEVKHQLYSKNLSTDY